MIGQLPNALKVGGKMLPIRTDFRDVLNLFPMFDDPELSDIEKAYVACRNLYQCEITADIFEEAVDKLYWFIDGGDIPKDDPAPVRILDWEKDERTLMPAISKTVSVPDVRSLPYMHWFTFVGAFGEMGEGLFSMILNLRRKLIGHVVKVSGERRKLISPTLLRAIIQLAVSDAFGRSR